MRRLLVLLALAFLPWTAFATGDFVFAWGLVTTTPVHVTTLPDYLFVYTAGLPQRLLAWPVSTLLYLLALGGSMVGTVFGKEDGRVTGGLLALAGASQLWFAVGMVSRSEVLVIPLGTVLLWTAAWWFYWDDVRGMFELSDSTA